MKARAIADAAGALQRRIPPFPAAVLAAGLGLFLCALANALSRATLEPSPLLFWAGLLIVSLPIFYRLTSREASTGERLALVCLLGLALYGVKIARDAPMFTFPDELVHAFNEGQITAHHELFRHNPILSTTPYYPGLEGATSALTSICGLSSYAAGLIVVGAARLVLVAGLFLLFFRVGRSARVAGLGAALYAGNFNFLYWGAQFSYESLALPLLVVLLMALAEREATPPSKTPSWAPPLVVLIAGVTVTHHLTSYAMVVAVATLALLVRRLRRTWRSPNPWPFAVVAAIFALAWLLLVATSTVGYLSPVLSGALKAVFNTIAGESPPRALFGKSGPAVPTTPQAAQAVALLALLLLTVGLPFGLLQVWRRFRRQPFALLFALAAIGFFGTLALRLTPPAWETGNRASEFLFIGLSFVLACAAVWALGKVRRAWLGRVVIAAAITIVLIGGAISGWPWDSQLARPLRVAAGDGTIASQPLAMAEWARTRVPGGRFAAAGADAGLLLTPGGKFVLAGPHPDIEDILTTAEVESWQLPLLRRNHLRYVVADRRRVSGDSLRGYYFATSGRNAGGELEPRSVVAKFNRIPGVARLYTNGAITVFDLEGKR